MINDAPNGERLQPLAFIMEARESRPGHRSRCLREFGTRV